MKIGLCISVDQAPASAASRFDYIEENVQNLLVPEQPEEIFLPRLAAVQGAVLPTMAANCFLPGTLKCTGPDVDEKRLERYAESAFRRAHLAGIRLIVFGSGGARQIPEGFDRNHARRQVLAFLRRIAPLAEREKVTIVLEPLNSKECNFINSLAEGAGIVKEVDNPSVRLLADLYHMSVDGESPEEIVAHGPWISHVHVAEREGRFAPETGGEDFSPYLGALKAIDYKGAISFECGWKDFAAQAAGSVAGFREQMNKAKLD